jgi:hypothetical protein
LKTLASKEAETINWRIKERKAVATYAKTKLELQQKLEKSKRILRQLRLKKLSSKNALKSQKQVCRILIQNIVKFLEQNRGQSNFKDSESLNLLKINFVNKENMSFEPMVESANTTTRFPEAT